MLRLLPTFLNKANIYLFPDVLINTLHKQIKIFFSALKQLKIILASQLKSLEKSFYINWTSRS